MIDKTRLARAPEWVGLTKHEAAVRRSLESADDAAARLDFFGALQWLAVIEVIGDRLPDEYVARRDAWALAAQGHTP